MFELHQKLKEDLIFITDLRLSKLMLYPDIENPWVVLIPQVENIKELHQLEQSNQHQLLDEINELSRIFTKLFSPNKINIGSLGNMVPQLHVHIICRFINDKAWPGAIWGSEVSDDKDKLHELKEKLLKELV